MAKLCLVDGSSYLYRAFHALPPLTNHEGQPTGAVYGVTNMLKQLIKDEKPDFFAVVFDPPGPTFRHELYGEYKANRASMPDDLVVQIDPLYQLIKALGYPIVRVDGFEADDVIGSLAKQAESLDMNVVISTSDKDLSQLVNGRIQLINTMSKRRLDQQGVVDKFGVEPNQIIDFLALCGDTSDNIPGIPGCGPKTAVKWLTMYQTLDGLVEHADKIGGKIGERLRDHLDQLPLFKQLVTIKTDIENLPEINSMLLAEQDNDKLKALYERLNFKRWLAEIHSSMPAAKFEYQIIDDIQHLSSVVELIFQHKRFSLDTETTGLSIIDDELVGIALSCHQQSFYIPIAHTRLKADEKQISLDQIVPVIKRLFSRQDLTFIGQNLKYDLGILLRYGIQCHCQLLDTMLMSYVYHSTASRHDLDSLAMRYLSRPMISYDSITKKNNKRVVFSEVDITIAGEYAAEDAQVTSDLAEQLDSMMDETAKKVLHTIDLPLVPVLLAMEKRGVLVDTHLLEKQNKIVSDELVLIEQSIFEKTNETFNLNSPKQLQVILFEKLGLPIIQKTPSGQPSTSEEALQELAVHYEIPASILRYRSLSKLKSTYLEALPKQVNQNTKRIHCSYNQAVTATGRLSSSNPNLQNIPVKTNLGREVRYAFIAKPGYQIIAADYSQIELRIMAHLSKDPKLCQAFANHQDVHAQTASELFNVDAAEVSFNQRRIAKTINFGLIYGMSAFGLSKSLGIERRLAKEYIDRYFNQYPGVKIYMEQTRQFANEHGYVETIYGRKLHLDGIQKASYQQKQALERQAINGPMQGSAADLIKLAMIAVHREISKNNWPLEMIMQVHDELVFEVKEQAATELLAPIQSIMENHVTLDVPLVVNIQTGSSWGEAH